MGQSQHTSRSRKCTCKTCGPQYVGSTKTKFGTMFNNHKTGIRRHGNLDHVQGDQDDLISKHFWGEHHGLEDIQKQLIDRVSNEEDLRDREGQWAYRLVTLSPYGLK